MLFSLPMAHLHKKMKKVRPYYYIREIARVDGKPKVVQQIYLGTLERILELARGKREEPFKIAAQEFGALWLAHLVDREVDLVSVVDSVIARKAHERGPSVGEYFLYAVFNRMIEPCSKKALGQWYQSSAIQNIRPVPIETLSSQRYWDKWERVGAAQIEAIASRFFQKIAAIENDWADCFLFDTTNYYTYMASDTESELAKRGKNKDGKDWLRQIGVALLVCRKTQLPLFYREYEGNRHDSKLFLRILGEVRSAMSNVARPDSELTLVFDKGMNSEDNIAFIDAEKALHFITTYSPYLAEELMRVKLTEFRPAHTTRNQELERAGREDDRLLCWRTTGHYWGRERTVVVTYNPGTAAKQRYGFDKKMLDLQQLLLDLRDRVRTQKAPWTNRSRIEKHYNEACERLHLPKDLYEFSLEKEKGQWKLPFRKDYYRIGKYLERFGKNILVTDLQSWTTDAIVQASLDRYIVEKTFRQSKDGDLVSVLPLRHWTDSKIRCHLFTCVVAITYLRLLENRLHRAGLSITAATAMSAMHRLHSCLYWTSSKAKAQRIIEEPAEIQKQILRALGYQISSGVLQESEA